jgi:hypothetical protein
VDAPVAKLDAGLAGLAILPGDLDPVQALDRDLPISSAIVCRPSPARRSTQARTRKWVPAACAAQKNS